MVNFFITNVQSLIVAIIFVVIIEMLLPDGANKKYVKIVSGIYIIITILNPFLTLFNKEFDLDFSDSLKSIETSSSSNVNMQEYYLKSMKEAIKLELKEKGFDIQSIEIVLSEDYSEIIRVSIKGARAMDEDEIKKHLSENYGVQISNVIFL